MTQTLSTTNHNRDIAGLKYVYPVISRRAGGLSIGINFNPNNACNWRCIYCQVPDLQRGHAPLMDFARLEQELRFFLDQVLHGPFYDQFNVDTQQRVIKDIAISGNGEPTSVKDFAQAIELIGGIASAAGVLPNSHFVLISNGSLLHQTAVQDGLKCLQRYGGELWFKLDSATEQGRKLINNTGQSSQKVLEHLQIASRLCPTKLQTCLFKYQDQVWSAAEKQAYLHLLRNVRDRQINLHKIMLYSIARQSFQPEAAELVRMSVNEIEAFAADIRAQGFDVSVSG